MQRFDGFDNEPDYTLDDLDSMNKNNKEKQTTDGVVIRCAFTRLADVDSLKPNSRNPNKHPAGQLKLYGKVIEHQGWRRAVVVSTRSGFIVTGHGAVEAAKLKGWQQVPVDDQDFASEADETAHMVADNKLSELSEIDERTMQGLLQAIGEDERAFTGFTDAELTQVLRLEWVDDRSLGNDLTDKVPREKEVFIVPIALTAEEYRRWTAKRGDRKDKAAFLDLIAS